MKITLVLGNGFDLDAGLKTSYKDFAKSDYWPFGNSRQVYGHDTLGSYLRERSELNTWFDVEESLYEYSNVGLGKATIRGCDLDSQDRIDFNRLKSSLTSYLSDQEESFNVRSDSIGIAVLNALITSKYDMKIYSFNYTNLQNIGKKYKLSDTITCEHIHGSILNNDIILGIGDKREINPHYFYLTKIAAPNYSSHHILPDMMESDEVVIFGHSLGSNDYPYFAPFLKRQLNYDVVSKKRKRIAIFTKDENGRIEIKKRLLEMTENQTTLLYTLNEIPIFLTDGSMEKEIGDYLKSINKLWE